MLIPVSGQQRLLRIIVHKFVKFQTVLLVLTYYQCTMFKTTSYKLTSAYKVYAYKNITSTCTFVCGLFY